MFLNLYQLVFSFAQLSTEIKMADSIPVNGVLSKRYPDGIVDMVIGD